MANKNERFFSFIQLLRYAAAVMVILFHLGISRSGYKGVDLFFIISGFVLFYRYQILSSFTDIRRYWVKRATKIYLLYWTCLIFYYFHKPFSLNASFFKTLFLIPGHYTIIPVSWSLSYELYFYLLFGFWTLIPDDKIRRLVFRIFLGISTLVVMTHVTVFSFKGTVFNFFFGQNIWEFLLGIFAGYIYQKKEFLQSNKTFWFVTALALFCFISLPFRNAGSSLVYGICGGLLVWSAARLNHSARGIHSLFSISGQASYSIYLISPLALGIFGRRSVLEAGILILAVSIAGIIINRFYEEPMLKRIRGLLVKRVQDPKKE